MKNQIQLFLISLSVFTRFPVKKHLVFSSKKLIKSSRYFSLVGVLVGVVGALVYYFSEFFFNDSVSVILSMISTILVTGALHETGFVSVFDDFGVGFNKEKKITIKKGSPISVFGLIGLISLFFLKHQASITMDIKVCFYTILCGHAISRFMATLLMFNLPYVQYIEQSRVDIQKNISVRELLVGLVFAVLPLFFFTKIIVLGTLVPVFVVYFFVNQFLVNKGIECTDDWVGAVQQITEVVFYLSVLIVL